MSRIAGRSRSGKRRSGAPRPGSTSTIGALDRSARMAIAGSPEPTVRPSAAPSQSRRALSYGATPKRRRSGSYAGWRPTSVQRYLPTAAQPSPVSSRQAAHDEFVGLLDHLAQLGLG